MVLELAPANDTSAIKFSDHAYLRPYLSAALQYSSLELPVIPCNGKIACVKWSPYQDKVPPHRQIIQWQQQYPAANLALITGSISNITVVDIDTGKPDVIKSVIARFGDTPVKARTPSGGLHLYYEFGGERSLTRIDNLPVDLRSEGGYVIAPPSINKETQRAYLFTEGGINKLRRLPRLKVGSLPREPQKANSDILEAELVYEGSRNDTLFRRLIKNVKDCSCLEELEDMAYCMNDLFLVPPLPSSEVDQIIGNVWRAKIENRLYGGKEKFLTVISTEIFSLKDNPRAFWLLMYLKNAHERRRTEFALYDRAIAKAAGWDAETIKHAKLTLVERGYLEKTYEGTNDFSDPCRYRFYRG